GVGCADYTLAYAERVNTYVQRCSPVLHAKNAHLPTPATNTIKLLWPWYVCIENVQKHGCQQATSQNALRTLIGLDM
ncbi:MAG: hypothetical protein ACRDHZ_01660, partial [Ktedonobacteraceae bacterium]